MSGSSGKGEGSGPTRLSQVGTDTVVAVAVDRAGGAAVVRADGSDVLIEPQRLALELGEIERTEHPRWVWWSIDTARTLVDLGVRPARCWDLGAVHRLLHGGWRADPARVWAVSRGLDPATVPERARVDLFTAEEPTGDDPAVRPDGHLAIEWLDGGWATDLDALRRHARLALDVYRRQSDALDRLPDRPGAPSTATSESAAELLCAELEHDGLPVDVDEAERIIGSFVGPRPDTAEDERQRIHDRDQQVLQHLPAHARDDLDLRNPADVKSLLRRVGIEVPDTRAWRLEQLRHEHPIVAELLRWRRAERIATTFGYRWLDEHVDRGRLRGAWSGADGAAGRMTATAGLHNLPGELRPAVAAEPGHVLVRSDLGQIEPRVLAAVSGDAALASATRDDDMYAPVAGRLGVSREIAKVAVLGAMYGQTTGRGAEALRGLERAYPTAMGFLTAADVAAQGGRDLRTVGGRLVHLDGSRHDGADDRTERSRAAARGRFGRNAMIQGAAAELFKAWAVTVRAQLRELGAGEIVLCLHDELLVHAPETRADHTAALVDEALQAAAARWQRRIASAVDVRFVTDTAVLRRWSDAKDPLPLPR